MTLVSPERGWRLEEIEFDLVRIEGLHARLGRLEDRGQDAARVLENVERGLEGKGSAIRRATASSGILAAAIRPTSTRAARIASVLRVYGIAVDTHARRANALIDRVEAASRAVAASDADLADAEHGRSRADRGENVAAQARAGRAVAEAVEGVADARAELARAWSEWEAAYARWDAAYDQAVGSLSAITNEEGRAAVHPGAASAWAAFSGPGSIFLSAPEEDDGPPARSPGKRRLRRPYRGDASDTETDDGEDIGDLLRRMTGDDPTTPTGPPTPSAPPTAEESRAEAHERAQRLRQRFDELLGSLPYAASGSSAYRQIEALRAQLEQLLRDGKFAEAEQLLAEVGATVAEIQQTYADADQRLGDRFK